MNKLGKHKTIITKSDNTVKSKVKTWFKNFFWFFFIFYQIHIIQIPITNFSDIQIIETGKHLFHFRDPLKIFCNTFYRKLSVRHGLYNVEIREIEKISIQLNAKFNIIKEFTTEEDC